VNLRSFFTELKRHNVLYRGL
jgi:hypothetical protein